MIDRASWSEPWQIDGDSAGFPIVVDTERALAWRHALDKHQMIGVRNGVLGNRLRLTTSGSPV